METMLTDYKNLFTSYWKYLALKTATKLELFDFIQKGLNTTKILSKNLDLDFNVLNDLINVLHNENLITVTENVIVLTKNGEIFTENNPKSLKYACIHWGEEHMTAWQNLEYTLKTGKSAFEMLYNKPLFNYLSEKNERVENYHKAMNEYARDDYQNICKTIDFSNHKSIMDVGGGLGALIKIIAINNPQTNCFLFDKPEVVNLVSSQQVTILQGDFFIKIPKESEVIIMSRVIHDWNDEKAKIILQNVYKALPENGIFYLIENMTDKIEDKASLLSLNMHLITKSYERTETQYINLLQECNFEKIKLIRINNLQYAIKCKKI